MHPFYYVNVVSIRIAFAQILICASVYVPLDSHTGVHLRMCLADPQGTHPIKALPTLSAVDTNSYEQQQQ
jgi:glutamate formiminotransferase